MTAVPADDLTGLAPARLARHQKLTEAASRIRVRPGVRVPVETILLGAASILFPLGLVFVILGWYGAAHTGHTYEQMDYLISGGLFGLGLSVAGGFMYFGYWLSRQLGESRRQSALTLSALGRLEQLLDASLNAGLGGVDVPPGQPGGPHQADPALLNPAAPADPAKPARGRRSAGAARRAGSRPAREPYEEAATPLLPARRNGADAPTGELPATRGPLLLATPRGTLLHRPECPVVANRHDLRQVPAGTPGFGLCSMCAAVLART
jgi:hypothetical protein